jgi:hypothetical protein
VRQFGGIFHNLKMMLLVERPPHIPKVHFSPANEKRKKICLMQSGGDKSAEVCAVVAQANP